MKKINSLSFFLIATVMMVAISCGLPRDISAEYYDDYPDNRYNGRNLYGNNPVYIERDPFTGRYYQVYPYGGGYYNRVVPYGNGFYSNRHYNNNRNNNRYYNNRQSSPNTNSNVPRRNNNTETYNRQQAQNDAQRKENSDRAREQILGPRKQQNN
jgi:hypothetical protein